MTRLPADRRKASVLEAAARIFAKYGYSGSTIEQLAAEAGISEPIIYRHFKSKKDLFIALVKQTSELTLLSWKLVLEQSPDPADRLAQLIHRNPMLTSDGRLRYRVIIAALTEVEEADIKAALIEHISALHQFLASQVRDAQESGVVSKRFSPELTAWMLMQIAIGHGTLAAIGLTSHGSDGTHHVDDIIGIVMLGEKYKRPA